MTERDGPMTPKAFHALFGRIGQRAKMPFPVHRASLCVPMHGGSTAACDARHRFGEYGDWTKYQPRDLFSYRSAPE
jgi:hypothetical protein